MRVGTWSNVSLRLRLAGTKRAAVVNNLHPDVKYRIRLFAENEIGVSEPSAVLRATTTEEGNASLSASQSAGAR